MRVPSRIKRGKRLVQVVNAAIFQRHHEKSSTSKSGLTARGKKAARHGVTIPMGFTIKGYHSGVARTRSTAKLEVKSSQKNVRGGPSVRERRDLHYHILEGTQKLDEMSEIIRSPEKQKLFLRDWLSSKIDSDLIGNPQKIAQKIVAKRLGLISRASRMGIVKYVTLNVTHGWIPELVFHELTGKSFNQRGKGIIQEGESMNILWLENGRVVLEYRGKRFDVTKKLTSLLNG